MNLITAFKADRLIAQIQTEGDPSTGAGRKTMQKLAKLGPVAIPKIIEATGSADRLQTASFVELLTHLCNEKTLPIVARGLMSHDHKTIRATAAALSASTRYNVNLLMNYLGEEDYSKPAIIDILTAHKDRLNIGRLLAQLGFLDHGDRAAVFHLIEEIATEDSIPDLLTRLGGKDSAVKAHLIAVLSKFDDERVLTAVQEQLTDKNKMVRQAALDAIARFKGGGSLEAICSLLLDSDIDVQSKAVEVIIDMNRPETVEHLLPALKSENEFSRRNAVEVLNVIGDHTSVKYLLDAVSEDDDWWVRDRACDALARIGGERVRKAVLELIKDKNEKIRRAAIEIINTNPDKSTVDELIKATSDADWWVCERAVDALAAIGDRRAVPALTEMLKRGGEAIPVAIRALGMLGDRATLKLLLPFTTNDDPKVAITALEAVSRLTDLALVDGVKQHLKKSVVSRDTAVINALEKALMTLDAKMSGADLSDADLPAATPAPAPSTSSNGATDNSDSIDPMDNTVEATGRPDDNEEAPDPVLAFDINKLEPGELIEGRYKFMQRIGKGAFGTVLLVEDTVVEENLILKFLNANVASDDEMMKRFVHELRYSRKITHKNVIRIYDFLALGGGYAISMEFFPSHTLGAEIARENPMDPGKALGYALDICHGMQIAHQAGIIHRDLKPANILINDDGLLKIVDFGVAAAAKSGDTQLTRTGYVIGSPKYMAPEQILGKKVDERADIYSLGVILYEMLSGHPPYSRGDHMSVMYQHVQGKAMPLSEANPDLPDGLSELVTKAMTVDKVQRYQSMAEFEQAITTVQPLVQAS